MKQKFEHLVHISFHGESEPPDVSPPPTLVNHEKPLILEEEPIIPFDPYPPPFPVLIGVPLCINDEFQKSTNHITNPSLQPSSTYHDSYPVEETLEWFMEPRVKSNPLIPQYDIRDLNLNIESGSTEIVTFSRGICHPL